MSHPASVHRSAPGFWQGLLGSLTGASRLFADYRRERSAIAEQERMADLVRLESRLPL